MSANVNGQPLRGAVSDHTIRFGAAYYAEYQRSPRLDTDLDLMKNAAFSVIRVGESVWSDWQPTEDEYRLDWLEPILDGAHARSIGVIVGTPTYAVPPWLRRKYPDSAARRRNGLPIPYGHRQDADFTDPDFRRLGDELVARIVQRYADHPAVIGWQVDNEPGAELLYNPRVFSGFVAQLEAQFGSVEELNRAWGLNYWSHGLSEWDDLWTPEGNTVPAYDLAWRRYQAGLTTDFIASQVELVRTHAHDDQFVTTCLAMNRPALDATRIAASLDVAAVNIYFPMQDALALPEPSPESRLKRPEWLPPAGVADLYFQLDAARGLKGGSFLVTETHAASIGESHVNYPPYPGQLRQAAHAMIARGATLVEYWHWHTLHSGHETYWGGVLGHDLEPGRIYDEVAVIGEELRELGALELAPTADALLLTSSDTRWAWEFQPPFPIPGTVSPDAGSAGRSVAAFARGCFAAGLQLDVAEADGAEFDVTRWPVIIAPALYAVSDALVDGLLAYVRQGGHLVLGPHTFYADESGIPREEVKPAGFADVLGAHYNEFTNLAASSPIRWHDDTMGSVETWADVLFAGDAEALATHTSRALDGVPAVVTRAVDAGRITYVGSLPDQEAATKLARWLRETSLAPSGWTGLPVSVTTSSARDADGHEVRFLANWSWEPCRVGLPRTYRALLGSHRVDTTEVELGPWDSWIGVES